MASARESVLPVAAAAFLVLAGVAAVATTGATATDDATLAFDGGVPAEYEFDRPTADGTAVVDGERYDTLAAALDAADRGDTVTLSGRFDEAVNVTTPGVTLAAADGARPLLWGDGEGDVLTLSARNVTVRGLWVANSGYDASGNDAAVWIDAPGVTVADTRITEATFGIWVDGVRDARLVGNTIVGRSDVEARSDRGNGIQLWRAADARVADNRITDARDGIYYSWASGVVARNNTLWDLRYGVHFMYSDDNRLVNNTAFGNDVGYALMVSKRLTLVDNVAFGNTGRSGHGVMVKSIDDSRIVGNHLVGNDKGLFFYNSLNNTVGDNLVMENDVGIHLSAGSVRERVSGNTFVRNDRAVRSDVGQQVVWSGAERGNYWYRASVADTDGDGVGESRYRPEGLVADVKDRHPAATAFTASPAFDVVRLAESRVPLVESNGVVDERPLAEPRHDWRQYYDTESN
jgi:nitrous oxidase accessory protein